MVFVLLIILSHDGHFYRSDTWRSIILTTNLRSMWSVWWVWPWKTRRPCCICRRALRRSPPHAHLSIFGLWIGLSLPELRETYFCSLMTIICWRFANSWAEAKDWPSISHFQFWTSMDSPSIREASGDMLTATLVGSFLSYLKTIWQSLQLVWNGMFSGDFQT